MIARPLAQQNVARCRDGETIFKVWTGLPPCCMDRLPPLCTDWPSSLFLHFPLGCLPHFSETHYTIPTSAFVFGGNTFAHPCFSTFRGMQAARGQQLVYL